MVLFQFLEVVAADSCRMVESPKKPNGKWDEPLLHSMFDKYTISSIGTNSFDDDKII